jgi:hypothetical protein
MMDKTPPLTAGQILIGSLFNEPMRVETVQPNGAASWIVGLVGTNSERFRRVTMTAEDLPRLTVLDLKRSFNGDGRLLRLGLQAYALGIAYEFDPYFGLSISRVDPLPHQLEAVYEYRRDCYWLYVVTDCDATAELQVTRPRPCALPVA